MKTYKYLILSVIACLITASCNDFLKEEPQSFLTTEGIKPDKAFVEAELMGAYKALLFFKNDRAGFIGITGTDEAVGKTVEVNYWSEQGALDKYNAALNADNWMTKWLWDTGYFAISRANNTLLAARQDVTGATEEWCKSIESEARFVRAVAYFQLAQFFGGVPIISESTDVSKPNYPREELAKVYALILEDLDYAENNIKTEYGLGRATYGAVKAMKVKTYMYAQEESGVRNIAEAKKILGEIEANNLYKLMDNYEDLFKEEYENGTESVYEFQFKYPEEPNHFQYFCGSRAVVYNSLGGGFAIFLPSQYYLSSFTDENDTRLEASVRFRFFFNGNDITDDWAGDQEYVAPHCKKYEDPSQVIDPYQSSKNIYYIRYADLILLYAECLNETGEKNKAVDQVNRIRTRAKASKIDYSISQDQLRDFIYEERMRELAFEGWRRFDLIRRGKQYFVDQVSMHNQFATGNVKEYHTLYPIPRNEIDMNDGISDADQNPGYK
ncbi:RagB/SusD family nutrient uptake outer membrane protein [Dysgonomonas sp. Marseille-P4677]|uniref:RagB/SusD family nutrient uptake outer membrane protein n=1 Tax=Dysgonomonas sp. Marseille-P4677 TaxID=2364790 RepID=UPI001912B1F6|nr:RagB/SusD family nutrient uptake outer membrane protein [Dysgonomonas sp. Marseille-P4677]MBK5722641.1 RagB/SusD family nutrient uptake outer membrane protein [Dysgonomonas sp. Marseille-P4677]